MDHARYLDLALEEAEKAGQDRAMPVGAIIVTPEGSVLSRGRNRVMSTGDQTAHAEIDAIRNAGPVIAPAIPGSIPRVEPAEGYVLYTSAQPCLMCMGAILFCSIGTVVWAAPSTTGDAYGAVLPSGYQEERFRSIQIIREPSPVHRSRSRALLRDFFTRHGNIEVARFVTDP